MIDTLLVSGCSFTKLTNLANPSWPHHTADILKIKNVVNLAVSGAGNTYICNSIIDYIEDFKPDPEKTLVTVMWSGIGRKDILVSGEYWYLLSQYPFKKEYKNNPDSYYVFSSGMSNSWRDHDETRKLFEPLYLRDDPFSLCKQSLINFVNLENYLKVRNYKFKFTSFINQWQVDKQSADNGDYSLGYFASNFAMYKNLNFDNWFFVDQQKNSFYEYAKWNNMLNDDKFHPAPPAHLKYAEQFVTLALKEYL